MAATMTEELSHEEQNAIGWLEQITAAHEAWLFCEAGFHNLSQQARNLSKEAKACLKEQGYDGTNHATVAEWIADAMREAPLSVETRQGWKCPGDGASMEPEEFRILLSTGGPALQIRGELNHNEPARCWLETQDWGKPWARFWTRHEREASALLWFAGLFWYGD